MADKKKTNTKKNDTSKAGKKNSKPKKVLEENSAPPAPPAPPRHREIMGGIFLALCVLIAISLFSTEGAFVAFFADLVKGLFGWAFGSPFPRSSSPD